jgi:hypothetical protein
LAVDAPFTRSHDRHRVSPRACQAANRGVMTGRGLPPKLLATFARSGSCGPQGL